MIILGIFIVVPILTYLEHRKVLEWMKLWRRNGLIASPPSIAIELQVLDLRRIEIRAPTRQEVE